MLHSISVSQSGIADRCEAIVGSPDDMFQTAAGRKGIRRSTPDAAAKRRMQSLRDRQELIDEAYAAYWSL
ncbi:hypothetical protein [Rubinisphaera brasiliensis]|nr:hypothetical protein [Rubinisphaera brasiliensis]